MKIVVSSKEFEVFLNAILRVEKEGSIITIYKDHLEALTLTKNIVSLLVYSRINILNSDEIDETLLVDEEFDKRTRQVKKVQGRVSIGIKDLKKFQRLLDMNGKDKDTFTFEIRGNTIFYSNEFVKGAKFSLAQKEHLSSNRQLSVTAEWFNKFEPTMQMKLKQEQLKTINAAAQFVSENVRKVYFYQDENGIVAEVNDKQKNNVDNIAFHIGTPESGKMTMPVIVDATALSLIYDKCDEYLMQSSVISDAHSNRAEILFLSVVTDNVFIKYLINGQKD